MATLYPSQLDTKVNPTSTNFTNQPTDATYGSGHAAEHIFANDAIKAIQAKVGINGSSSTTSLDYKLQGITGSDQAIGIAYVGALSIVPAFFQGSDSTGADLKTFLVPTTITNATNVLVFRNGALQAPGSSADYVLTGQNVIFNSVVNSDDLIGILIFNVKL